MVFLVVASCLDLYLGQILVPPMGDRAFLSLADIGAEPTPEQSTLLMVRNLLILGHLILLATGGAWFYLRSRKGPELRKVLTAQDKFAFVIGAIGFLGIMASYGGTGVASMAGFSFPEAMAFDLISVVLITGYALYFLKPGPSASMRPALMSTMVAMMVTASMVFLDFSQTPLPLAIAILAAIFGLARLNTVLSQYAELD